MRASARERRSLVTRPFVLGFLVLLALLVGGGLLAATAFQAGIAAGTAGPAVAPVAAPYWAGVAWHPFGFWLFGLVGFVLFLFLVFALLRLAFGRGHRGRWDGYGGPGSAPWERQARDRFDAWHEEAHAPRRVTTDPGADRPTDSTQA
jgi:hypothetical protein